MIKEATFIVQAEATQEHKESELPQQMGREIFKFHCESQGWSIIEDTVTVTLIEVGGKLPGEPDFFLEVSGKVDDHE